MRRLILKMSVSLDGFVAGPKGESDWIFRTTDAGTAAWEMKIIRNASLHAMGRRTYYDMAAYWPPSTEVFAAPMNDIPKVVFSRKRTRVSPDLSATTRSVRDAVRARSAALKDKPHAQAALHSWENVQVATGNLRANVQRLKRQPGKPILAHGGAGFARSLIVTGLIDEYHLLVHPVILGRGMPIFTELTRPADLKLIETRGFKNGAVAHVYRAVTSRTT